jgi:hypothetical protein
MMPPDRSPSISVGIIVSVGAAYDSDHHWRDGGGGLNASVAFQGGGFGSGRIQGEPAALRELAAALTLAADQAEAADLSDAPRPAAQVVVGS